MKTITLNQMEMVEGGRKWSWSGCVLGSMTGFELASTTAVFTGGWGLVAGLVGGCVLGGVGVV